MMLLTLGYEVHVDRIEHSVVGAAQLPKQICTVKCERVLQDLRKCCTQLEYIGMVIVFFLPSDT